MNEYVDEMKIRVGARTEVGDPEMSAQMGFAVGIRE